MDLKPSRYAAVSVPKLLFTNADLLNDPGVASTCCPASASAGRRQADVYSCRGCSSSCGGHGSCPDRRATAQGDSRASWVWVLPPLRAPAAADDLSPSAPAPVIEPEDGATQCTADCDSSSGRGSALQDILRPWQRQVQRLQQRLQWPPSPPHDDVARHHSGGGGSGRMMLLASLTTSAVGAAAATATAAATGAPAGSGAGGSVTATATGSSNGGVNSGAPTRGPNGLFRGFNLPQLSIMQLPVSASFAEEQDLAQEVLDYHIIKNGGFPRPCPRCKSADFLVERPASGSQGSQGNAGAGAGVSTSAAGGGSGDAEAVVEWSSRPLRCETCGAWMHLGCAGVRLVEQVPPRPWFHSRECRDTYLRLEAAAARNPQPSMASPAYSLYLLTPADMAVYGRSLLAAAVGADAAVALPPPSAGGPPARGPTAAVLTLLSEGLSEDAVQGFNEPTREYDGGKYSAVLLHRGQPVAAATFNVFGSEAQLCLLATAVQHRRRGHGTALVSDLEAALADLGVSRVFVQSRGATMPLWVRRLGYSLVHPEELPDLHRRLPLSYYDCALLSKSLTQAGGENGGSVNEA